MAIPCSNREVALATCADLPMLTDDDRLLVDTLEAMGIDVSVRVWSDEQAWQSLPALVVIRTCWDYHRHVEQFVGWIRQLERRGTRVVNTPACIEWNVRKRYLVELENAGIHTGVPTVLLPCDHSMNVTDRIRMAMQSPAFDWSDIIAKPEVSATAWETYRLRPLESPADMRTLERLVSARSTIVQPFINDIVAHGELSLVYFGGIFSHAVVKQPRASDFRVQEEHGGSTTACIASPPMLAFANHLLLSALRLRDIDEDDVAYARVDLVNALPPRLMELELVEPGLFLGAHPAAPARFAEEIVRQLQRATA